LRVLQSSPSRVGAPRPFTIALDEEQRHWLTDPEAHRDPLTQRRYVERITRIRLHQPIFRSQLLRAYERCAV